MNNLRTEHYKSAKQHLEANGVNFNKSGYFELSSLERDLILSVAKQCGYKKNTTRIAALQDRASE